MHVANIIYPFSSTFLDYPDNESFAVLVYITGCEHECTGCHNKSFRNIESCSNSSVFSVERFIRAIDEELSRNRTKKLVLSGGDPLHPENIEFTKEVLKRIGSYIDICIYTGYDLCYIEQHKIKGFHFIKCGPYIKEQAQTPIKTDIKMCFASKNQRLYNKHNIQLSNNIGHYLFE